jgi:hypothetical protein
MSDAPHRELASARVSAGSRTYFFDLKESQNGVRYLVISESREGKTGYEHHRVMVFEEHLDAFCACLNDFLGEFHGNQTVSRAEEAIPKEALASALPKDRPVVHAKWTLEDDERLWSLHEAGCSLRELETIFQREPGLVQSRLTRLTLERSKRKPRAQSGPQQDDDGMLAP